MSNIFRNIFYKRGEAAGEGHCMPVAASSAGPAGGGTLELAPRGRAAHPFKNASSRSMPLLISSMPTA